MRNSLLSMILSCLDYNFITSGIDDNGKAFAETDSEIAADALEEILYDIGYIKLEDDSFGEDEPRQYSRNDIVEDGAWRAVFKEL